MPLNQDGFCTTCHQWALEYPGLACPWCASASADQARADLSLDPDTHPAEVINACRAELEAIRARQRQVMGLRSVAARAILRGGNAREDARRAHTYLNSIERWAVADQPAVERARLAPFQTKSKRQVRVEYEERMRRREELFVRTVNESIPERLRPALGEVDAADLLAPRETPPPVA